MIFFINQENINRKIQIARRKRTNNKVYGSDRNKKSIIDAKIKKQQAIEEIEDVIPLESNQKTYSLKDEESKEQK